LNALLAVAVPLDDNGGYVFAAYAVFLVLVLIYVGIIAAKISRTERALSELNDLAEKRGL
jgi:isoprenylcysteine carboxyl methyltransferase (ICMT) family protein YpbQ